jgi:hypothetical protein
MVNAETNTENSGYGLRYPVFFREKLTKTPHKAASAKQLLLPGLFKHRGF